MLSIGELSRRTGVKVPTIRYYEQMGLITPPLRSEGNQRRYSNAELERLAFIRHARELGISIDTIRELARLSEDPEMPCLEAHEIANQHLDAIRQRIVRLQNLERELVRITAKCDADHIGQCYVIQSLIDHGLCESDH